MFSLVPPNFSTRKKIANQPITAAVPVYPVTKKSRDWLLGSFLFVTKLGGTSEKNHPVTTDVKTSEILIDTFLRDPEELLIKCFVGAKDVRI